MPPRSGKTPVVVGGTGFYLRWFIHGRAQTPASNPQAAQQAAELLDGAWARAQASLPAGQALSEEAKWHVGVDQVAALGDPEAAARIR